MSTKSSIKWRDVSEESIGYHLYDDVMDSFGAAEGDPEPPVYLRLDGVEVELSTLPGGGVSVTAVIPREAARELGLLPPAAGVTPCGSHQCIAGQRDGVLCADGECDRENGVRPDGVAPCGSNGTADCQSTPAAQRCAACPHGVLEGGHQVFQRETPMDGRERE